MPAEDSGGTLPPDPTWRERAPYSVRFLQPAKLSFRNHTFELEQSAGSGGVDAFDQVTCWPSGELLARAMDHPSAPFSVRGRRVLELGSGTGVAGLMAAALGAVHVTLTDLPEVLPVTRRNAERFAATHRGCAPVDVRPLDWESDTVVSDEAPDVILAADATVFVQLLPALERTIHRLAVPATEVYIMHQRRGNDAQFLLDEFGRRFEVEEVALPVDLRAGCCALYRLRRGVERGEGAAGDALEALAASGDVRALKALYAGYDR